MFDIHRFEIDTSRRPKFFHLAQLCQLSPLLKKGALRGRSTSNNWRIYRQQCSGHRDGRRQNSLWLRGNRRD
ncbi:Uncharacterised protein [Vibrio cholerae]|nr:Uncharacterised protein [Vibrio cholerae]